MYIIGFDGTVFHAPKGNCNVFKGKIVWKDSKDKKQELPCEYVRELTATRPDSKIQTFDYGTR